MSAPQMCMATRRMKIRYATEGLAEDALADVREMRSHGKARGKIERRVYQCPACKDWHLTSED